MERLKTNAEGMGLEVKIARGGYLRISGDLNLIREAWLAEGCDLVADHGETSRCWKATFAGKYVGGILTTVDHEPWAYSYTSCIN